MLYYRFPNTKLLEQLRTKLTFYKHNNEIQRDDISACDSENRQNTITLKMVKYGDGPLSTAEPNR